MDKNDQKAQAYNNLLFQHGRVTEQIRLIRADKFELNENDIKQIKVLEKHDTDEDDYNSSGNFPWGSSNALKLFLVEKGDPYIKAQNIYAKKKRQEYAQRTFEKIVKELNTITNKSDLDNWGKTFAQDYSEIFQSLLKNLD